MYINLALTGLSDRHQALTQMSRAGSLTPAAVFLTNVGGAIPAQLGPAGLLYRTNRGVREGGEKGEDDSFPSLSPGSQVFSLTGVASAASSSVSIFLSFIFTRRASISWPTEGICRGGGGEGVGVLG